MDSHSENPENHENHETPTDDEIEGNGEETPPSPPPPPRRRRRRPNGRWTNPSSPLQAARFARRASGKEVVQAIRKLCPGHGHGPCRIDLSKLSDYVCHERLEGV
jgi:hypothetical protein